MRSGRELHPLLGHAQQIRDGRHQQGLGEARRANEEAMAARRQGREGQLDHILLAEHDFAQIFPRAWANLAEISSN